MSQRASIVLTVPRGFSGVRLDIGAVLGRVELADGVTPEKLQLAMQQGAAGVIALADEDNWEFENGGPRRQASAAGSESGGMQSDAPAARRRRAASEAKSS